MKYTIREMTAQEYPLLDDFLYEAIFVPEGVDPPSKSIITAPELQVYVKGFGASKDDFALVAEVENKIIGAVWVRIMNDYGHMMIRRLPLQSLCIKNIEGRELGAV